MTVLCIIPGPSYEYRRGPDTRPTRWCFGCRKHLRHERVVYGDPPDAISYYDRIMIIECTRCHRDRTIFPGCDA